MGWMLSTKAWPYSALGIGLELVFTLSSSQISACRIVAFMQFRNSFLLHVKPWNGLLRTIIKSGLGLSTGGPRADLACGGAPQPVRQSNTPRILRRALFAFLLRAKIKSNGE